MAEFIDDWYDVNDEDLTSIEDFEMESNGCYVRLSIDKISEKDRTNLLKFIRYVVNNKKVPDIIFPTISVEYDDD